MRLGEYFRGRKIVLHTRLAPEEAERRIDDAAQSVMAPFAIGVVGWAKLGIIRLRYRRGIFGYDAKPILAGGFVKDGQGTRLDLVYRGPLAIRFLVPLWGLIFVAGFALIFIEGELVKEGPQFWIPFAVVPILVFGAIPLAHAWAIRRADEELVLLVDFLRETVGATGGAELERFRVRT